MGETQIIPYAELSTNFLVRKGSLDDDRVDFFIELYESGAEVPPIKVAVFDGETHVVDGRYRHAALGYLEREMVEVEYVEVNNRADLIIEALNANLGGALPPTRADMVLAVTELMEEGVTQARIREQLEPFFQGPMIRGYIDEAKAAIKQRNLNLARNAVLNDGMTISEAAKAYKVDEDDLKVLLGAQKPKKKLNATQRAVEQINSRGKSDNAKLRGALGVLLKRYEDGEIGDRDVNSVMTAIDRTAKARKDQVDRYVQRFGELRAKRRKA